MNSTPDITTAAIKMVFSLGLILAVVWGLYRLAKNKLPMVNNTGRGKLIQVVESHCIGVKKHIAMVKVPGSVLVLGIGSDKMALLSKIEDPEVVHSIEAAMSQSGQALSFKDHLRRLTGKHSFKVQPLKQNNPAE